MGGFRDKWHRLTRHRRLHMSIRRWRAVIAMDKLRRSWAKFGARLSLILDIIVLIAAVATVVALVLRVGFDYGDINITALRTILRSSQIVFILAIVLDLVLRGKEAIRQSHLLKWIGDGLILLTLFPLIFPHPAHSWMRAAHDFLFSPVFFGTVMGLYSLLQISYALMRLVSRRTNPSILMGGSFLFFIIAGTFLLMLPRCHTPGSLGFVDSLFVSTSAVCITGLSTVDIPTTFTPLGTTVLAFLIQIGGLGVLTFTCFFAMFFSGSRSIYNQLLLRDLIYSRSMNALVPVLLYILGFTLTVEIAGAALVFWTLPADIPGVGSETLPRLGIAAFHSLSSFCNAGFSYIPQGMSNPGLLYGSQRIYWVTSLLIFAGGIGFPNLVNFKEVITHYLRKLHPGNRSRHLPVHIFDLNTKLVLVTTITLLVAGTVAFYFLEYDNTLAGMSQGQRMAQSVFNSLTPRSAGFASVNPARFLPATLVIVMLLMWIGGASQSLAGGIKVNTLAAVLLNLRSILRGYKGIPAFHRNLSVASVRRAQAVVILSILSLSFYVFTLCLLEPGMSLRALLFEAVSALFTVGSSLGITPELSEASKILLCTAMFLGRVGLVSLLSGFLTSSRDASVHYASDNIIIN